MKRKYLLILLILLASSLLLSACGGSTMNPSGWPGVTVVDNIAYVAYNQQIYGVQINNGTETTRLPEKPINGSTTFFHKPLLLDENTLIVGDYKKEIYAFNLQTKTAAPFFTAAAGRWIATPIMADGLIFAPNTDKAIYALDTSGQVIWSFVTGESIWADPVLNEDLVYIASMDSTLYALDAESGQEVWNKNLGGALVSAPFVGEDGTLYIGTFNSEVLALDGQTGEVLWRVTTDDWVWGSPVASDGVLYITDLSGKVYAVDLEDQSILWQFKGDGAISGSVLLQNESVVFATSSGDLYCLNLSGGLRWQAAAGGEGTQFEGTPVGTENSILVSAIGGDAILYAYNLDGGIQWQFVPQK